MSDRSLIIVLVDGLEETERTLRYAVTMAATRGADVRAVRVVPRGKTGWAAAGNDTAGVRIVTLRGTPERVIPAYAQMHGASLIIAGRHYGSSRLWRNTGVASRLSRSSPVPVLFFSDGPNGPGAPADVALNRIVAAVDFTVASGVALRTAVDLSRRHGARLTVLHAMDASRHMVLSGGEAWRLVQRLPAEARALAERLKRKAAALGSRDIEPVVVTGRAHAGIVDTATATAADLVVMGVAPRGWIDEVVSGSTLRAVLRRARTPVLVLPAIAGAHEWIEEADPWADAQTGFVAPYFTPGSLTVQPPSARRNVAVASFAAGAS
jgi:nucleotide-binding universal stress UspA family protein